MTGPAGEQPHGYWDVVDVEPPNRLTVRDGFADAEGTPSAEMPTTTVSVTLAERDGGTRMQLSSRFASREGMEQLLGMGMEEGLRASVGQMDDVLAAV